MGFTRKYRDRVQQDPGPWLLTGAFVTLAGIAISTLTLWGVLAWDESSWLTWAVVVGGLLMVVDGLTDVLWALRSLCVPNGVKQRR